MSNPQAPDEGQVYGQPPVAPPYGGAGQYPAGQYPPFPGYGGGYAPPPYAVYSQPYPKNSLGIWSLVLAIVSFFTVGPLASIPAVVLGVMGRRAADEGQANNRSLSTAGLVVGWVNIGLVALAIFAAILFGLAFSASQS